jgi:hypothetical protein
MLGRDFLKRLRLLKGRSEIIKTRFELDESSGRLVEHVTLETHDHLPATPRARRLRSSEPGAMK